MRGNNKPFIDKSLRKAIATRTRLLNIARKTCADGDYRRYNKQGNFVKCLNFKTKRRYYKYFNPKKFEFNKKYWTTLKPFY